MLDEKIILNQLITNEDYSRKVAPFLDNGLFENLGCVKLFDLYRNFVDKYNTVPNVDALHIDLKNSNYDEVTYNAITDLLKDISNDKRSFNLKHLIDESEAWAKDRKMEIAIRRGIEILDDKKKGNERGKILDYVKEALSYSFNVDVGHDYLNDWEKQYEWYHKSVYKLPFRLKYFNDATNGGLENKTLNIFMAPTGLGKSLMLCDMAAYNLSQGKNVLYISGELSSEKITQRQDANLLDVSISYIDKLSKQAYEDKYRNLSEKTKGTLIIKEYPTATAHVGHFRALLKEIELKKNKKMDVIYVDYLNIFLSQRYNFSSDSYTYVKGVAEELRGLAGEYDVPIVTATQTNREGSKSSDYNLSHVSESFGISMTADAVWGLIVTEELKKKGYMKVKYLKSRYVNPAQFEYGLLAVNHDRMRFDDVTTNVSDGLITDFGG